MIEVNGPNKDIIEMTKAILRQHENIININKRLMDVLAKTNITISKGGNSE